MKAMSNTSGAANESQDPTAIRPFHFKAPQAAIEDLKKRKGTTTEVQNREQEKDQ